MGVELGCRMTQQIYGLSRTQRPYGRGRILLEMFIPLRQISERHRGVIRYHHQPCASLGIFRTPAIHDVSSVTLKPPLGLLTFYYCVRARCPASSDARKRSPRKPYLLFARSLSSVTTSVIMPPHHIQPPTRTYLRGIRNPPPTLRNRILAKPRNCPNPACVDPKIEDVDDKRVCTSCGTVISDSNIVSEIQFGESSSGAAVVQGSFVGADQSHARSMGTAFKRAGGMESREIAEANGTSRSLWEDSIHRPC